MLLNQETLRLIFGFKLRGMRHEQGYSLKELAKKSGLSPSYINEIEKGKKYPKNDKILVLAAALGVNYDDLISLKLTKDLGFLSNILESNVLGGMPFEIFGIPAQTIFQLMAERPQKFSALVGTVLELARTYNLKVDDFFFATLRSYLDLNNNYFPDIENEAEKFRQQQKLNEDDGSLKRFLTSHSLVNFLSANYNYKIEIRDFKEFPEEIHHYFYFLSPHDKRRFFLNRNLSEREKVFILCKEIGICFLNLKERLTASSAINLDSYAMAHNNFIASYFAGALIIPKNSFVKGIKTFIKLKNWDTELFSRLVTGYQGTIESYFHRLSQVLPTYLQMGELFLIKFNYNTKTQAFYLDKELHLSKLHDPHEVKNKEHYCRRWITYSLITKLIQSTERICAGSQRSSFYGKGNEYMCLSMAWHAELDPNIKTCMTIGILLNDKIAQDVNFVSDPVIIRRQVGDTCEQCGVHNCKERASPPIRLQEKSIEERAQDAIDAVTTNIERNN